MKTNKILLLALASFSVALASCKKEAAVASPTDNPANYSAGLYFGEAAATPTPAPQTPTPVTPGKSLLNFVRDTARATPGLLDAAYLAGDTLLLYVYAHPHLFDDMSDGEVTAWRKDVFTKVAISKGYTSEAQILAFNELAYLKAYSTGKGK